MSKHLFWGTLIGTSTVLIVHYCIPDPSEYIVEVIFLTFSCVLLMSTSHGLIKGSLLSQVQVWIT